jgi:Tol biopolymer transport system component
MDWAPAWSPDGSQLAFVSDRDGSYQIYVMRADGTGVRRLTEFPQGAEAPAWSPDGYWLAFVAYAGDGPGVSAREIYLMRADGRDQVRLTYNAFDDAQPDWQPGP